MVWVAAFTWAFFNERLPNNAEVTRWQLWAAMPDIYLELLAPTRTAEDIASGWSYLPQRFPSLLAAAVILSGAWGWGGGWLRVVCSRRISPPALERFVLAMGLGLSWLSLVTLVCGKLGRLDRSLLAAIVVCGILIGIASLVTRWRQRPEPVAAAPAVSEPASQDSFSPHRRLMLLGGLAAVPFILALVLGATLPPVDFDVREYHLQGPKEFFLAGRVEFLAHNVYTSFPFLTEMLSLLGMVLCDDWYMGALSGKAVLSAFPVLAAAAVAALGRRLVGGAAGLVGGFILLTTPWMYRIGIIAYAEGGLTFYLIATALSLRLLAASRQRREMIGWACVSGLCAGSAMACKYTGLVSVVAPAGAFLISWSWSDRRESAAHDERARDSAADAGPQSPATASSRRMRRLAQLLVAFGVGVLVTVGPWLLKNGSETGNPVYPLAYRVFGGVDWSPELNAKWRTAHAPPAYRWRDVPITLWDVSARSDWLSPLLYAFAPVALVAAWRGERGRGCRGLVWYALWLYGSWWLLTHRIDRFWVPMLPVIAVLAGAGAVRFRHAVWRGFVAAVMVLATVFNLGFITTPYAGLNTYLADLDALRPRIEKTGIRYLNARLPDSARVLSVGEAALFDARFPYAYNTVFDVSLLETWCRLDSESAEASGEADAGRLRPADAIRSTFSERGITHVYVDWQEILRYRTTYGYTPFVSPDHFAQLVQAGVLAPPVTLERRSLEGVAPAVAAELRGWGRGLLVPEQGPTGYDSVHLFDVLPDPRLRD